MRKLSGASRLGLLIAVAFASLNLVFPNELGSGIFLAVVAAWSVWFAGLALARAGMVWMAAGFGIVALACGGMAWFLVGQGRETITVAFGAFVALVVLGLAFVGLESRAHPSTWRVLAERVARSSLRDLVLGRHIRAA